MKGNKMTTTMERTTRKSVPVPLGNQTAPKDTLVTPTLVTLTFTLEELAEVHDALVSHRASWAIVSNNDAGKREMKKMFGKTDNSWDIAIKDGRFAYVGGKAKKHYLTIGKVRTMNKFASIAALVTKAKQALEAAQ